MCAQFWAHTAASYASLFMHLVMSFSCVSARLLSFFDIVSTLPASSTSMFVWTTKTESARGDHYIDFQHLCHIPAMN